MRLPRRHHRSTHAARSATALTFLEVVAAVALLAILASAVSSAFTFMHTRFRRERQLLGAYELANRMMLQYLDDPAAMPDPNLAIAYGAEEFRWTVREDPVVFTAAVTPQNTSVDGRERRMAMDRLRQVSLAVWLAENSGGSLAPSTDVPHAEVTRLVDPRGFRNPDTIQHILDSPDGLRRLMEDAGMAPASGNAPGAGPVPGQGTPKSPSRPGGGSGSMRPGGRP